MAFAQRLPAIPSELNFGGSTVYINAQGQQRLKEEMTSLYADRAGLNNAIEQTQYIESVLSPLLEERAVPADFRYACLPTPASNGTYWGIDARKADRLNLRVDNSVDERLNVVASSEAVLGELALLHTKYPNWMRVLLEYAADQRADNLANAPQPGGAAQATDQVQLTADSPPLVWLVLARKLVFESENAVPRATTSPFLLYDYRQGRGKSLAAIARELGIEQARFIPFNDWLRVRTIPTDKVYPVLIRLTPAEFLTVRGQVNSTVQLGQPSQPGVRRDMGFPVLRKLPATTSADPLTRASAQFYQINDRKGIQAQPCDNIITLAYYGQLSVKSFMEINDMTDRDLVRPGEIYYLEAKDRKAKIPFHVMQPGQTIREVSTVYGIRMKSLLKYNHLESTQRLQPGRILWLREKRPDNVPAEYQVLPEPVPEPEPTIAERKLTRENEEPLTDSLKSGSTAGRSADSTANRPAGVNQPDPTAPPAAPPVLYYTVKEGDTHSGVSQRYNLPLSDLMNWNNLSYRKPLVAGQRLIVGKPTVLATAPATTEAPRPVPNQPVLTGPVTATTTAVPKSAPTSFTSAAGRPVVSTPASRTPVAAAPSVGTNRSATAPAKPRPQRIVNQVRVETPKVNGTSYYHVVQRGQTVYRVALINRVRVQDVMRWNNLTDYTIEIGQRILIKK